MSVKHTPLPWECDSRKSKDEFKRTRTDWVIYPSDLKLEGEIVDTFNAHYLHDEETRASNAAFIVRACNSHYELLEAAITGETIATAHFSTMKHDDPGKERYIQTVDKMRAAIAKATGAS